MLNHKKIIIGWKEWCELPMLNIPKIKAKIDTGAKTSALHADDIKDYHRHGTLYVKFEVHPIQNNNKTTVQCHAEVIDERVVTSSNGLREKRYVIQTPIQIGELCYPIEVTLTNRDVMTFRFLLGRSALQNMLVAPSKSHLLGSVNKSMLRRLYRE